MKKHLALLSFGSLTAFVLSGCAPIKFSQYSGARKVWQVSPESMAETSFTLPVYRSWPDKPYEVIGSLRWEDPNQFWDDGVIEDITSQAKHKGGDAIVIRYGSEFGVSSIVGSAEDSMTWQQSQMTALVIKWKPQSVLDAETALRRRIKEELKAKHPELCKNNSLVDSTLDYLQYAGLNLDSTVAADKLHEILAEIHDSAEGELSGKWLYRCNFSKSLLTSAQNDFFYGVSLVTLKEDVLTIVSTSGPEVSFSGTFNKGRVTGKMGISKISVNCDGVASKEKISLSGQGQIPDGTFQASLVFLR